MEDLAKVIIDRNVDPNCDTGDLEQILNFNYIDEPQEIRSSEEFTVKGAKIVSLSQQNHRKNLHPKSNHMKF